MNIRKLDAEHSIDFDLLPDAPVVLDVGCRGFAFDIEMLKLRPRARIIALDPDPSIPMPEDSRIHFLRMALTELPVDEVRWQGPGDGAYIINSPSGYGWGENDPGQAATVDNITLKDLMEEFNVAHFDVIKLDCESSEFGILENLPGKVATQISVEFHNCMNREKWNSEYFYKLFTGPLKDYNVAAF